MKKETVLVTGVLGFLGRNLLKQLVAAGFNVVGIAHSENSVVKFRRTNDFDVTIPIYLIDVSGDPLHIKNIINRHSVKYIIHAAALKHVGLCEENPARAIEVNVGGSQNILKAASECGVENVIGVSTDKSINPSCVYGMTKKLMERMFLENDYGIFQGVNFFFSSDSVLELWQEQRRLGRPLLVNTRATRFFVMIDDVSKKIVECLDTRGVFFVEECYRIDISVLQDAFSTFYDYWDVSEYIPHEVEKDIEEIHTGIEVIPTKTQDVVGLLKAHFGV